MDDHAAEINRQFEVVVACCAEHDALAVIGREIARLRDIEAVVTEYAAARYDYETMPRRPDLPFYGDGVREWKLRREALEARIAAATPPYKALLRELGET